ncbi:protein C19orf12 homolog [Dendroctonus ponderosae]
MNDRRRGDVVELCKILAEQENLQATVVRSGKGALYAGMGVFIGGLLAGPLGMAIGGSVTSIAVAVNSKGTFKSVVTVINEMSVAQKRKLADAVQKVIGSIKGEDCVSLVGLILASSSIKQTILTELGRFLMKEMQMQLAR